MKKVLAIVRREMIAYFSSPLAYIVLTAFLLMQGLVFYLILSYLNNPVTEAMTPMQLMFGGTYFFWLFLLFMVPVITMRLVAEEKRSGTLEVLLTSPLTEAQVIAGKFLAALCFYVILWLPTVLYVVILKTYSAIDLGPVASGYLGVLLVGFAFLAVGTFTSTLTNNQLIAAILAFLFIVFLFCMTLIEGLLVSTSVFKPAVTHMSVITHMESFGRGIVDTRHVVFQLTVGLVFLFLATKSLEAKKWR